MSGPPALRDVFNRSSKVTSGSAWAVVVGAGLELDVDVELEAEELFELAVPAAGDGGRAGAAKGTTAAFVPVSWGGMATERIYLVVDSKQRPRGSQLGRFAADMQVDWGWQESVGTDMVLRFIPIDAGAIPKSSPFLQRC